MRELLILTCCAVVYGAVPQSIRDIDWKNFSYPLLEADGIPGEIRWITLPDAKEPVSLANGGYIFRDDYCSDNIPSCPSVTLDFVTYGALTEIKSSAAAVVLTYYSGGTAHWQYVYVFGLDSSSKPRLLAWLRTGSRAAQGLRQVSITGGDLVVVVNDPNRQQGDCCSAGSISTRYRWVGKSFSPIGQPVFKTDPPSFDCAKAATPVERLICRDVELSFLDSQVANSYRMVLKGASIEHKEMIRRQQAEWFADYGRTCNAPLPKAQRRDCIDRYLTHRLVTIWQ